jgi:hypothetical protein
MMRMRFPSACLLAAVLAAAPAAFAQTAPSEQARIDDIQISADADKISILVKLSHQPVAAIAKTAGNNLVLELNGLSLAKLKLEPPAGSMIRNVEADDGKLTLSGAAFGEASTVIYRNAVMIEAKLAEPALRGASLMPNAAPPLVPKQPEPQAAPEPTQVAAVAAPPPATPAPVAPAPAAPTRPANQPPSAASLAKLDTARCAEAAIDLKKDPWSVPALGDHALCLLDMGSSTEANSRLDQLAAFAPEDWRVALGRAVLAQQKGDASNAEIGYRAAAMLAPDPEVRAAISAKYPTPAGG